MLPADSVLSRARADLGYHVPVTRVSKFTASWGVHYPQPWCADAACRWLADAGHLDVHPSASTIALRGNYRRVGRLGSTPRPGALAFFHWPGSTDPVQHVGVVEAVRPDGRIVCLEGNTSLHVAGSQWNGGSVARKVRSRSLVVGYGYPRFVAASPAPAAPARRVTTGPLQVRIPPMSGQRVTNVQAALHRLGSPVAVDGAYGPATAAAVRRFQRAHGLAQDGAVGPVTLAALRKAIGH